MRRTLSNRHGSVTVTDETVQWPDGTRERRFVVAGSSGYRAVLPACGCERMPCPLRYKHGAGVKGAAEDCEGKNYIHCHGWHWPSARRVADEVLGTYGSTVTVKSSWGTLGGHPAPGVPRDSLPVWAWWAEPAKIGEAA